MNLPCNTLKGKGKNGLEGNRKKYSKVLYLIRRYCRFGFTK